MVIICATISSFEYANIAAFKYYWDERGGTGPWLWGWEIVFSLDFLMKFFVDYQEPKVTGDGNIIQRNWKKIAIHYYYTDFWTDFLPLIPFQIVFTGKQSFLFYFVKVLRVKKGVVLLNVRQIVNAVKNLQIQQI